MEITRIKSLLGGRKLNIVVLVVVAFLAGYFLKSRSQQPSTGTDHKHPGDQAVAQKWYCSMDPDIIRDKPGKCPKCGMDLVPMPTDSAAGTGPRELVVSEEAAKLMEIETSAVERKFVTAEIRMVGKIDYDETRVKNITAWVPGRIDRLFVDFTGITVKKGDHMVELYSPELISAQAELLLSSTKLLAREKLRLLGLTAEQIEQIEKTGKPVDRLTIYAPIGGVVIHKNATEGMYVDTGTPIYRVADLSHLWVKLDAYESDLPWLQYGQQVEFTTEAYPGEVFKGRITFIHPILNDKTRTVKVRVNVDNADGGLKPDMFVRAVARAKVAKGGKVMASEMAGKWICPMHPAIVKDSAAACDICGMDLVTAESLGFVVADTSGEPPLVIPVSAALVTGRKLDRAVVYVQKPDAEKPTFEGREIVLGPRAGDYYIVKSGLAEGEIVVTNGNFKIDSAMQIQAKPSMMSPEGEKAPAGHHGHSH
jgi:Cu(I)/Ag(I) efflux system membrane fusion protein